MVVICFYNEHWITLWRTIYSIVATSDGSILEIILIDDRSDMENLHENLTIAVASFNQISPVPVKLIRQKSRTGLIKSRLAGSRIAVGDTMLFLDSHIECLPNWLPPLKAIIYKDYR